jgi:hypothetical protein
MKTFNYKNNKSIELTLIRIVAERVVFNSICNRYCKENFKELTPEINLAYAPRQAAPQLSKTLSPTTDAFSNQRRSQQ